MSSEAPYGHILSDKSAKLQRDTFFFAHMGGFPIRLVLGLNQQITPVTSATLRRWADLMVGEHHEFFLSPVTVNPKGIMSYSMTPSGPVIPPDSDEPLPPGNYGWYRDLNMGPSKFPELTGVNMAMRNRSLDHNNVKFMDDDKLRALRCRVTGDTADIMITWIVPPPWGWTVANSLDPPEIAPKLSDDVANAITLRKDLKLHFYSHNFTVDSDDNYRIVILCDMATSRSSASWHLRYSMNFMLLGGDIREKYPPHVILHEMDQLGVPGPCDGDDPDGKMAAFDDPRWQGGVKSKISHIG
ncbi:hypothetical protein GGX14DRAFT_621003 [Mycena pura]|uniref:Ig-like domain-containing protein n=1 Tax=Mycena pura TaxID=153505 RepID=A0AAD6YD44_9AGAR|nr:hypothetical protein GGX14DRAFT_621003 [Mycena pura]